MGISRKRAHCAGRPERFRRKAREILGHGAYSAASCILVLLGCLAAFKALTVAAGEAMFRSVRGLTPEQIQSTLEEILAQPEYNSPLTKWLMKLDEISHLLVKKLSDFFSLFDELYREAPVLYYLVVAVCVGLLLLTLAHIGYTFFRALSKETNGVETGPEDGHAPETAAGLRARAESLASEGAYIDAIRMVFRSLLLAFQEKRRGALFNAQTNREFVLAFREEAALFKRLQVIVGLLDDKWYGMKPCSREDYELCRTLYDQLMANQEA